jgi:hypothetical protein
VEINPAFAIYAFLAMHKDSFNFALCLYVSFHLLGIAPPDDSGPMELRLHTLGKQGKFAIGCKYVAKAGRKLTVLCKTFRDTGIIARMLCLSVI